MSELGDLLELMHGARERWRTVRVVIGRWSDQQLWRRAMERDAEAGNRRGRSRVMLTAVSATADGNTDASSTYESTVQIWKDPARARVRTERSDQYGESFWIRDGDWWWSYHPTMGATSNEGDPNDGIGGGDEADVLLDPALILGVLNLEITGDGQAAGRSALAVRATPRDVDERDQIGGRLPGGADEFELLVDAERGVVLRMESRLEGAPFNVIEALEVSFDETFPDQVFTFEPPAGEQLRSRNELFPRPEALSLEETSRRAPFTVLAPRRLPKGWSLSTVSYFPERERPPSPAGVVLQLMDLDGLHQLRVTESTESLPDSLDWEEVESDGERFYVHAPAGLIHNEIEVKLERHGTHARLSGNVERSVLLEIARSFEPAPRELPPLVDQ